MSIFRELMLQIRNLLAWWIVISPWEQAVRVRLGKHLAVLEKGIHLRLPFIDVIYKQTTRLRYTDCSSQTISTLDGKTVAAIGTVGYTIRDIRLLYETLHHADDTIMNCTMAAIAKVVRSRKLEDCDMEVIEEEVAGMLDFGRFGLGDVEFHLIEFANVRTLRLIQGQKWVSGERLSTINSVSDQ